MRTTHTVAGGHGSRAEHPTRREGARLGTMERAVLLAGFAILALALVLPAHLHPETPSGPTTPVRVHAGVTLWSLASESAGPDGDTRAAAREIMEMNGLTSAALPEGTSLVVPAGDAAAVASR